MQRYTDEQVAELLQWKLGSVRYVKRQMRQRGFLQKHESMDAASIQLARQIANYQSQQGSTFANATLAILNTVPTTDHSLEETLAMVKRGELAEIALLVPLAERLLALEKKM